MRLLFCGTPETALPALDALIDSRHDVVGVLTRPDAKSGRGRKVLRSPVRERAEQLGLPVLTPRRLADEGIDEALRDLDVDCAPVVAYGALIPDALLTVFRHGWVNLHFSLLPAWRGAAPVQHAIWHGDDLTGASTFRIEAGPVDTGPVFGTVTETVRHDDTSGDLLGRLAVSGARLLAATMDAIESGSAHPLPQPPDGVSTAAKITTTDARVRWREPALAVDRRVRACTPAPGAWTLVDAGADREPIRLKVGPVARLRPDAPQLTAGAIQVERTRVLVGTGSHAVELGEIAPPGKSWMPAADWARGARLDDTARCLDPEDEHTHEGER